ncbi:hypothetical protein [Vibrio ziniensis]|uniref:Uncharacterized protein n=1 Tax=Vibrio ziniensis TaxID=2711221 RepID=A0A6G7CNU1_9VIBR|nr:hypothetical protein [Vibrio ziniensis]QIH43723.1 hypothetical protein G5S32_17195 [Vibrio ziniensis]
MARAIHDFDVLIIELLQQQGLIKKEAEALLKNEVYRLEAEEIQKIKNYATHFGLSAKDKLIQEILDLRRETLFNKLSKQLDACAVKQLKVAS